MRKAIKNSFVVFLAAIIVISLCSCEFSLKNMPKIPSMNFTSDAQIHYKSYDALMCKITSVEEGDLTINITEPVLLSGFSIVCRDDSCTIKYGSISYDADTQKYPQLAFGNILKQAVESVKENRDYSKQDDGNWLINTQANGSDVQIVLDAQTCYPLSLKVPSQEFEITFSNFVETDKASN